jgi:hypothetical protein
MIAPTLGTKDYARTFDQDRPFRPDLIPTTEIDLGEHLGMAFMFDADAVARNAVIVELAIAYPTGGYLHYSRGRSVYAAWRRYFGKPFTRHRILTAIDEMAQTGIITNHVMRPGSANKFQSRMRLASGSCVHNLISNTDLIQLNTETVRLKDAKKRLKLYTDDEFIRAMRHDIAAQNELLDGTNIDLDPAFGAPDELGMVSVGSSTLNLRRRRLFRVFNLDFDRGGRWYGPWWQSAPSQLRKAILIDTEPTIEIDYSSLHPRLLAAACGTQLTHDPYEVDGHCRSLGKRAFNIALNARSHRQAVLAVADQFRLQSVAHPMTASRDVLDKLRRRNPYFDRFWGSGVGLRLQRIDGDICADVQRLLRNQAVPALSVHDSFLVPSRHEAQLQSAMAEAFDATATRLRHTGL